MLDYEAHHGVCFGCIMQDTDVLWERFPQEHFSAHQPPPRIVTSTS
jgi:hypothetical protein